MKYRLTIFALFSVMIVYSQSKPVNYSLKQIVLRSLDKSHKLKICSSEISSAKLDKSKAYQAYLPKISSEVSYTHLNSDIDLPSELEDLLYSTEKLLIKESAAMQMAGMAIPDNYKVGFTTPYNNPSDPASVALANAVKSNWQEITPIQKQDFFKANVSAQLLLFSGLKVPYSVKAANYKINALEINKENETSSLIAEVINTYDRIAVLHKSEEALNQSEKYVDEQMKFVNDAYKNGLAINLDRQKVQIAKQQIMAKRIELNSGKKLLILRLNELTGIPEDSLSAINPNLEPITADLGDSKAANTNTIKSLDKAIMALDYKRKAENTEYIPKIVAFGKKEFITRDLSAFDPQWYVGVGMKWNIFDGMTTTNNAQHIKIEQNILTEKKQEAEELIEINLKKMKYDYEKDNQLIEVSRMQVNSTKESFELTKKQYEQGLATMTDYLNSVNAVESASLELTTNIYNQRVTAINWLDASGKLSINNINN